MWPHLGQGGCQGLEDAATLAHCVDGVTDADALPAAFARFAAHRRPRARALARESRLVGRLVNARPAVLGAAAMRASALVPKIVLTRHLASIKGRAAFVLDDVR